MSIKYYSFAGCTVKLISDTPVQDTGLFANFICDEIAEPSLIINIKHSALPEKTGKLVFSDNTSSYYVNAEKSFYFTSYPVMDGMKSLACRVIENDEIALYVVPGQELWDSLIAFAVNYTQLLFYRGIATMHCSCIEVNGKAVLFAGDKCVGKSTQADLWNRYRNARIINGDRIALKFDENRITACGIPFCGSSDIALNEKLDVKAVVFPGKAKKNIICRLNSLDAFKAVLGNLTYNTEDIMQSKTAIDIAEHMAKEIPAFSLICVPDESSVEILEEQLCQI